MGAIPQTQEMDPWALSFELKNKPRLGFWHVAKAVGWCPGEDEHGKGSRAWQADNESPQQVSFGSFLYSFEGRGSAVDVSNCKCTILSSNIKDYRSHRDVNNKQILER